VGPALLAVLAVVAAAGAARAQDGMEDVRIRSVPVRPGLFMLVGRGGNIGVVRAENGLFLVDDQYAPLTPKILDALEELGGGPVRFVLNTHWHGDHTGGNENLGRRGALLVAHHAVRERMSRPQRIEAFDREVPASPPEALPVVTFGEDLHFHLRRADEDGGDLEIRVFHVESAHTDGDAVVHFEGADAVHAGDVFFNGFYPFIDVSSGGSLDGLVAAAERVLALCGERTRILPGHGPLADRGDLERYVGMLREVRRRLAAALREGRTPAEIATSGLTADLDASWGDGFLAPEDFLRMAATSLQATLEQTPATAPAEPGP